MTHTPGPWTIEEYGDDEAPALVIHKGTETRVCFMATPGSHGDPSKIEADAHLIVAAPVLLAALKTAPCPGGGWTGQPKEIAHATVSDCLAHGVCGCDMGAAVLKAEGKSQFKGHCRQQG